MTLPHPPQGQLQDALPESMKKEKNNPKRVGERGNGMRTRNKTKKNLNREARRLSQGGTEFRRAATSPGELPRNPRRSPVDRRGSPENLCRNLGECCWNPQLSPGEWRGSLDNPRRGFGEVDRGKSTWMPSSKNTGTGT
ncbi:hypothetical protein ILYODFUR_030377 [Ilyodon furcidens]|uniref:Uncharacterized protein n=1 Tax=Ilyodon furcidens TaxID=33524 RepID=A0ABV0TDS6_9TELE